MDEKNKTYLEFNFQIEPLQPACDILVAELSELGFESFVEHKTGMLAYIEKEGFEDTILNNLYIVKNSEFKIEWTFKVLEQQNWNAEWEKSFHPIKIGKQCMVRAPFHPEEEVDYDIIIEPKMSFGTGHHETTHMMLQHILDHDFKNKTVLDMGCGTGVLAILAAMKGAVALDAIDIDNWSYVNALENVARNQCQNIMVQEGNSSVLGDKKYDIILANINRNVLLEDIPLYASCLNSGGYLFLSGFYFDDLNAISAKCSTHGLRFEKKIVKNHWVSPKYVF